MQGEIVLAVLAFPVAGLLLAAMALLRGGSARALRERVRAVAAPAAAAPVALPSIRVAGAGRRGPWRRLFRYDPDIPRGMALAWPLVALAGLAVAALAAWGLGDFLGGPLTALAAPLAGLLAVRALFGRQQARYRDAVFQQIPDALGIVVRAIRAGLPLAEALRSIAREMPSPTREEFARVAGDMAVGRPVEVALARLHERTGLTEYAFLAVTLGLQAQTGGSLAETLENLSEMVRKRVAMAKRARALAGEAKAQAGMLVVLPFLAAAAMAFIQPFYLAAFTQNPTGQRLAMIAIGMMGLGLLTIRWMIRRAGRG